MLKIDIQLFGGRGSSSSGGTAGAGGTVQVNVKNSTSLVSQREGKQTEVDQTLAAFKEVNDEYGYIIDDIKLVDLQGKGARKVIAYYDENDKTISTNRYFFKAAKMDSAYDDCVAAGFHPGRGNKSGTEAVAYHELGHGLTDAYAKKNGYSDLHSAASSIVSKAEAKLKTTGIGAKISGYAKRNAAETISEAFADVKCNGKNAKKESKTVVDILNAGLK